MVSRGSDELYPVLGRDDEAELVAVLSAPFDERPAVLHVALGRIDLAFLAVAGHAVAFEIAQMRVHRLGADELPSARGAALRVELHDASLHRHPPRPRARTAPVPAPGAPALECQHRCSPSATRVEPAAALPGPRQSIGVAASAPDRLIHLADKAGRTGAQANAARGSKPAATVADLAGTDAEIVFVVCHETTIGSRDTAGKREKAVVVCVA